MCLKKIFQCLTNKRCKLYYMYYVYRFWVAEGFNSLLMVVVTHTVIFFIFVSTYFNIVHGKSDKTSSKNISPNAICVYVDI